MDHLACQVEKRADGDFGSLDVLLNDWIAHQRQDRFNLFTRHEIGLDAGASSIGFDEQEFWQIRSRSASIGGGGCLEHKTDRPSCACRLLPRSASWPRRGW